MAITSSHFDIPVLVSGSDDHFVTELFVDAEGNLKGLSQGILPRRIISINPSAPADRSLDVDRTAGMLANEGVHHVAVRPDGRFYGTDQSGLGGLFLTDTADIQGTYANVLSSSLSPPGFESPYDFSFHGGILYTVFTVSGGIGQELFRLNGQSYESLGRLPENASRWGIVSFDDGLYRLAHTEIGRVDLSDASNNTGDFGNILEEAVYGWIQGTTVRIGQSIYGSQHRGGTVTRITVLTREVPAPPVDVSFASTYGYSTSFLPTTRAIPEAEAEFASTYGYSTSFEVDVVDVLPDNTTCIAYVPPPVNYVRERVVLTVTATEGAKTSTKEIVFDVDPSPGTFRFSISADESNPSKGSVVVLDVVDVQGAAMGNIAFSVWNADEGSFDNANARPTRLLVPFDSTADSITITLTATREGIDHTATAVLDLREPVPGGTIGFLTPTIPDPLILRQFGINEMAGLAVGGGFAYLLMVYRRFGESAMHKIGADPHPGSTRYGLLVSSRVFGEGNEQSRIYGPCAFVGDTLYTVARDAGGMRNTLNRVDTSTSTSTGILSLVGGDLPAFADIAEMNGTLYGIREIRIAPPLIGNNYQGIELHAIDETNGLSRLVATWYKPSAFARGYQSVASLHGYFSVLGRGGFRSGSPLEAVGGADGRFMEWDRPRVFDIPGIPGPASHDAGISYFGFRPDAEEHPDWIYRYDSRIDQSFAFPWNMEIDTATTSEEVTFDARFTEGLPVILSRFNSGWTLVSGHGTFTTEDRVDQGRTIPDGRAVYTVADADAGTAIVMRFILTDRRDAGATFVVPKDAAVEV